MSPKDVQLLDGMQVTPSHWRHLWCVIALLGLAFSSLKHPLLAVKSAVRCHSHPGKLCICTRTGNSACFVHPQDFAHGSDVVIHESVGPVYIFNYGLPPASTNILTNHTSQQEVGGDEVVPLDEMSCQVQVA